MKKLRHLIFLLMAAAGAAACYTGEFVLTAEKVKTASSWCIGIGAAVFALGIGKFLDGLLTSKFQTEASIRRKNIEVNDERNIRIREKVGAKTSRIINYALCAVVLVFAFMNTGSFAILMVVSVMLLEFISVIALSNYYSKRM